jgi:signal transduction histidine kinase
MVKSKNNSKSNKQDPESIIHDPVFAEHLLERMNRSGTIVLDSEGKIVYASAHAEQILNTKKSAILNKDFFDAITLLSMEGQEIEDRKHPVWRALQPQVFTQMTPFFCSQPDRPGQALAMNVLQIMDKNKLKAVLVQIRKAEREVNVGEMKTLFVSFAAHQLKTPSSIVKGFLELLIREGQETYTSDQWNYLISAFESNEQLIHVSKSLLSMARLEGGLIEPQIRPFNPHPLVQNKIQNLSSLLKLKGLSAEFAPEGEQDISSDDNFFLEIFEIIFANAIKHSPNDSRIDIRSISSPEGVTVHVIDQGRGIPDSVKQNLFKTAQESEGDSNSHGLGLYMAKKYLALLGGTIGVESSAKGSDFYFYIPNAIN